MFTEVTQLGGGQSGIHSRGYLTLEPMPFTGKVPSSPPFANYAFLPPELKLQFWHHAEQMGDRSYTIGCRLGGGVLKCAVLWLPSLKVLGSCFPITQRRFRVHFDECILLSWYTRWSIWHKNEIRSLQSILALCRKRVLLFSLSLSLLLTIVCWTIWKQVANIRRLWL